MKEYNAVVIGAGNGGLSAAIAFAQAGLKPLVIERHNLPGGCASSFVRGRFEFDVSLHSLEYESSFKPTFEGRMHLNEPFPPVKREFCNVYLENGTPVVEHYRATEDLPEQIETRHPGCGKPFARVMKVTREVMEAFTELTSSPNPNVLKIFLKHPAFLKYGRKSVDQVLNSLKVPEYVKSLFSIYWWYGGSSPSSFPFAIYSMMSYYAFVGKINFPEHTAHGYLAQMEAKIRELGGDVWYNTAVTKINTENGKVVSVETDQGDTIRTELVLCNMNPGTVLDSMLTGADDLSSTYIQKLQPIKENFTFMNIYLGLDASAEEIGLREHHCIINEDEDRNYIYDCCGTWDGPKTLGVNCPNVTIPDFSPEGTCVVTISVPVKGNILEGLSQKDYIRKKHDFEMDIITRVEKYLGIDLHSHIEEIDTATPATLARFAGLYNGALGVLLDWDNMQTNRGIIDELNRKGIKGLHFTGQFAGNLGYQNTIVGYMAAQGILDAVKGGK